MRKIVAVVVTAGLAACDTLPAAGPLSSQIEGQAGKSRQELNRPNASVFDTVDVDQQTARTVANFSNSLFSRRFGIGGRAGRVVIGIGDQLKISIFEAGSDGLFSTSQSKQTTIDVVVQPDGTGTIPYVGPITLAGKTQEEARKAILAKLVNKAVEPDVLVTAAGTASRSVTVSGAVGKPSNVELTLAGDRITEVIARAGGPASEPYESYVTLVRGTKTASILLKSLIENPRENIYVEPRDQIYVTHDPRTFTILGQVEKNNRVPFGASDLNLLEAIALAGGGSDNQGDAEGYFVFRYEEPEIVMDVLGAKRFHELQSKGLVANKDGRYPIVYRFNMHSPDSLLVGQSFPIKNRDVIYAARHPTVDFLKFMQLIATPVGTASGVRAVAN
ncbi:polysaccharide biosynthesis/export family protein [Allorhizobium taibaishanense]|uniref:Capsule biosynthesis protein n=1 Tax=Allorhizobium taibaishanense TaxID=887144 RepID=A0A1Q9ABU0_9HYPH|nr:polysaccharide biosynthesis/export family protein [Allorhizobium taibaishanense]MBB4010601.1 polysaccharide export outer membrane protein [Allorhizobium taibaishanense]OLP52297.1 capsule biosynthesis protein [Allorhizobium taibaishanense]